MAVAQLSSAARAASQTLGEHRKKLEPDSEVTVKMRIESLSIP